MWSFGPVSWDLSVNSLKKVSVWKLPTNCSARDTFRIAQDVVSLVEGNVVGKFLFGIFCHKVDIDMKCFMIWKVMHWVNIIFNCFVTKCTMMLLNYIAWWKYYYYNGLNRCELYSWRWLFLSYVVTFPQKMQGNRNAWDYLVIEYLLIQLVKQRWVAWIIGVHLLARIVTFVDFISRIV